MRLLDEQTKLLPISSEYYEALLADLEKYMQLVEHDVITIICDRLRKIGEMNPTSKKQISDLVRFYGSDMDRIKKAIAKRLKMSAEEVDLIFEQAATDSADFATALAMGRQDLIDTRRMEQLAMAAAKRYKDYLLNLPDTFAFKVGDQLLPIRKAYIALTNQATLAVQSGALDYSTAIRNTVKRLADNGLQVINWESGYHRRADSSVRMNVMEGVRQLNQGMLDEAGKKFATGYELSAHDRPAPDHADIQGKQYTKDQFEALNSGLKRPIGTLNCMHIAYPIIYGVTKPTYSEDELEEMKANSKKEYEWQGKKLDGYECTQKQRWYETEIRKSIDRENALKAAGDVTGYRIEALKTSKLRMEYKAFSRYVGLSEKLNRTENRYGIAQGYTRNKKLPLLATKNQPAQIPPVQTQQAQTPMLQGTSNQQGAIIMHSTPLIPVASNAPAQQLLTGNSQNTLHKISFDPDPNLKPEWKFVKDVREEFANGNTPGIGKITYGENYNAKSPDVKEKDALAEWMLNTFGGEIEIRGDKDGKNVKNPDFSWNGKLWELKSPTSKNALGKRLEDAIQQIKDNPGGVILSITGDEFTKENVIKIINGRTKASNFDFPLNVMVIHDGKLMYLVRYEK